MVCGVLSVRVRAVKWREGRVERGSTWGMKRMVGWGSLVVADVDAAVLGVGLEEGASGAKGSCEEMSRADCRRAPVGMVGVGVVVVAAAAGVGPSAVAARLLVIPRVLLGSGDADSVDVDVGCSDSLLSPLRPCTVGNHPCSPLCIPDASALRSLSCSRACCDLGLVGGGLAPPAGLDVDLVSGGASALPGPGVLVCGCRWVWV